MKIVLIHPPPFKVDFPPLSVAYLAAKLKQDKYDIKVFDFNVELYHNTDKKHYWDFNASYHWNNLDNLEKTGLVNEETLNEWTQKILNENPRLVGISVHDHSYIVANKLSAKLKNANPNLFIVYGGPFCNFHSLKFYGASKNVDAYVVGEGEFTLSKIAQDIKNFNRINLKSGIILNQNGRIADGGMQWIEDINKIPMPAFSFLPMDKYTNKEALPILFSRGCHFNCKFCSDCYFWGRHRMRYADNIIDEIKRDIKEYGVKEVNANDLLINGNLKRLEKLASRIIEEKIDIKWGGMVRVLQMSDKLLALMKKAGCYYFTIGIESGSQRVLNDMNKGITVRQIEDFLKKANKAGIKTYTLWMVGYYSEKFTDFIKTLHFIYKNRKFITNIMHAGLLEITPESDLYLDKEKYNIIVTKKREWWTADKKNTRKKRIRRLKLFNKLMPILKIQINKEISQY